MAAWVEWLAGLVSGLLPPAPGTHEAVLEEYRAGGQLRKELDKPPGQQDEELVHRLRLRYRTHQMRNVRVRRGPRGLAGAVGGGSAGAVRSRHVKQQGVRHTSDLQRPACCFTTECLHNPAVQAIAHSFGTNAASFEQPADRACCAAVGWVRQRVAASYRALADYHWQWIRQVGRCGVLAGLHACFPCRSALHLSNHRKPCRHAQAARHPRPHPYRR